MAGSSTPDGVRLEIRENALVMGNPVKDLNLLPLVLLKGLYADANGNLASAAPFPLVVTSAEATTAAIADIRGASTLSATGPMTNTIVAAAAMTTFTSAGFARVAVTDAAGNVTAGNYYIQFGTLT